MAKAIYFNLCEVCKGELSIEEIESGRCKRTNLPLNSKQVSKFENEFFHFFKRIIGEPREIQKFWARRIFKQESFAAVAPTGIGKTSFGTAMALFLALKGKKSYIILPTALLVKQVIEFLKKYAKKARLKLKFNEANELSAIYFHAELKKSEREKFFNLLETQNFSILVTTTQFLSKHFPKLKNLTFDFIFVDDVDAILKRSKNVEKILRLLGFKKVKQRWIGKAKGILMVSTATVKKGKHAELFRELLDFDVGSSIFTLRNIDDIDAGEASLKNLSKILRKMGKGGIIYAASTQLANEIHAKLSKKFKIGIVTATNKKDFERFEKGELHYLVGTAYYYGTLVRGLDLPEKIRYAVFYGAPVFKLKFEEIEEAKVGIIRLLAYVFSDDERIKPYLPILPRLSEEEHKKEIEELRKIIKENLLKAEKKVEDLVIRKNEVIIPDVRSYLQASGRTSRLFAGGITKGASFLLENDEDIKKAFIQRASYYQVEFKPMEEINWKELKKEIDESRKRYKERGKLKSFIKPVLFIVESPTKAKQISRFFGKPSIRFVKIKDKPALVVYEIPSSTYVLLVTACLGHITDLITDRAFYGVLTNHAIIPIYSTIKRCRKCGYQFTQPTERCPRCKSEDVDDSRYRIEALRMIAYETGHVIIGTDPDEEGEKIAWDLKNLLRNFAEIKRAEFHEVTKHAILDALQNLRDVDEKMVESQIVRRIEDRWTGFALSEILQRTFKNRNLSAGRVQTPVLGWVVERCKEHKEKKKIGIIKELGISVEGLEKPEVEVEIKEVEQRLEEKTPLPPYTTDTLLRDANAILKLSAKEAIQIAQTLFENGLITYHRTDSTRVSEVGLKIAKQFLGKDFKGRTWKAEGAHECIRPTRAIDKTTLQRLIYEKVIQVEEINWKHLALYDLIFKRFMSSQCKNYKVKIKKYEIWVDGKRIEEERVVEAKGKAVELYKWNVFVKPELPLGKRKVRVVVRQVPKVPLYSQSDLVQLMKERKIGRPSTYATIIDRLFLRNYVKERKGKVWVTPRGLKVYYFLSKRFSKFVSEERTRILHEIMEKVERGEIDYQEVLRNLLEEVKVIKPKVPYKRFFIEERYWQVF